MKVLYLHRSLLVLSFLTGCAWKTKELTIDQSHSKDLTEKFEIDRPDLDKFKVVRKSDVEKKQLSKISIKKESLVENKKSKIKKTIKNNTDKKVVEKASKVEKRKFPDKIDGLPKNYAQKFIEYDQKAKSLWMSHKERVFEGEEIHLDVKYFGVTAGKVVIKTMEPVFVGGRESLHFSARMKSAPFYRYIYELDDYLEVYVERERFLPLKYSLVQRESKQDVDDLQLFDHDKKETHFLYKKVKEGKTKKENKQVPTPQFYLDSFSVLFFIRGLPLEKNKIYEFPIITRAKLWLLKFEVVAHEKIKIKNTEYDAIKIKAETRFPGILKKRGDILFWFSNDKFRKVLKFEANVKIGALRGVLVDYKEGTPLDRKN